MSENCEFCGEPLDEGICQNIDCPQGDDLPAISESVEEFPGVTVASNNDSFEPVMSDEGEFDLSEPEVSSEAGTPTDKPAISVADGLRGSFLTMDQAAVPVDHTGTVILGAGFHLAATGQGTRLTDDQNYQDIQTILKESITSDSDDDEDPTDSRLSKTTDISQVKERTNRPELSQTIRLRDPFESDRTAHRLPSRSLSVPTDSASMERRKQQADDYNLESKDYKIVSKVGEGGSGVIYEAQQIALRRRVAVKVLKQRGTKQGSRSRTATKELEKRKARFLHEVNITAKLQHPNIIPLYDLGVNARGEVFYAMKLIGETADSGVQLSWASLVRTNATDRTSASIEKNVQIFEKVCDAIRYAHAEKIVHRDLKPDNVMVGKFGEVLVIDWGMALDLSNGKEPFTAGGTTAYMPPEMGLHYLKQSEMHLHSQTLMMKLDGSRREDFVEAVLDHGSHYAAADLLQDDSLSAEVHDMCRELLRLDAQEKELANKINFSSDIYLLGAILYELAVGHPPHYVPLKSCKNVDEKHHREFWLSSNQRIQRLNQITDPLRLSLCNISLKALQNEQNDRYRTVDELQQALTEFKNQVQSLQLVEKGRSELEKAQGGDGYLHLLPALESFRAAETLFPLADDAQRLQIETACEYAKRADRRKDYDAGLSILDEYVVAANRRNPEVMQLAHKLHTGKKIAARNRRLAAVGWLAAVILPIGVWGASWMQASQLRSDNAALAAKSVEINQELAGKQKILDEATNRLETSQQEIAQSARKLQEQDRELTQKMTELTEKNSELAAKTVTLTEKTTELEQKTSELTNKETELNSKNQELEGAKTQITIAQQQAEQLRFESAEGLFNSLILPIPMDLRKGDLDSAAKRLQALQASDLNPQFKNDWVARHFAKTLNVAGIEAKLGNGTEVIDILHSADQDLLVIGTEADELKIWSVDAESGKTELVPAEMPQLGKLSQATLSADGNWLALGLDHVSVDGKLGEPIWLIHLGTGKRVGISQESNANPHVLGCRALGFINDATSPNQFQLVTVEELSAYRGLKERLQIVTRNIAVNGQDLSVSEKSVNLIEATTRDDRRVQYAVTMNLRQAQPILAAVYSALDSDGGETLVLETMVANEGASQFVSADKMLNLSQQKVAISQIPTAMHLSDAGKLYCGHANGRIDLYEIPQMTEKPTLTATEHESTVTVLSSSANGTLISGGANGLLVVLDQELKLIKRLVGQSDQLTAISVADSKSNDQLNELGDDSGFQLASGGATGHVRVWQPESTTHDAAIRKQEAVTGNEAELRLGGNRTVTCGAVDRNWMASEVPAAAYGTSDGQVYYFSSDSMRARRASQKIPTDASNATSLSIPAPPGSFDTTFDNFDSFGILENQFVLLQSDGQLFSTLINTDSAEPSGQIGLNADAVQAGKIEDNFRPLLATVRDQPIFFTNNPVDGRQILAWRKTSESGKFKSTVARVNSKATGRIKRLRFSSDGCWLAAIREAEQTNTTGEYVIDILSVGSEFGPDMLQSVTVTGRFRVGDPAFVSFASDSRKLMFHFHKLGVDRETWIETWSLAGNQWFATDRKRRVDERPVDLMAWDGAEELITRINKQFYVSSPDGGGVLRAREYRPQLSENAGQRLRSVQPAKVEGDQYVLFDQSLGLFDDRGSQSKKPTIDLSNARDIQVFGDRAIVLDDSGFHLIDEELNYVALIARRKIATTAMSLSHGRLAVRYDVGGLCRILDVSGEVATEIGRIAGVQRVQLSPDGKWAACQRDAELQIYSIETKFEQPSFVQPVMAKNWSVEWIGTSAPKLLVAIQKDETSQLEWKSIDPQTKETAAPSIRLPQELVGGQLAEFQLAQHSQKYLALTTQQKGKTELELWAVSTTADPILLSSEPGFRAYDVNPIAVAFSEIQQENKSEIGTRMIVLNHESDADGDSLTASSRIFLLADEQVVDRADAKGGAGGETIKTIHRVFEIEGVIDVTDGRQLLDAGFSGDGRSLLEVDNRGLKLLLSKDW